MSIELHHYLSDSGGNFTEMATRPPVPGEENDRQSNGGNSTLSSGSYKSHLSASSAKSENKMSPAVTPRRSNLDKTSTSLSYGCQYDEAPLGFEPEGSAASSPPFTESSTPPFLKWAENLNYLLEDRDGVKLYKDFLEQENCQHLLSFWFACQGFKIMESKSKLLDLAKVIYKRYIKSDKLNIGLEFTKPISKRIKTEDIDSYIFDHAQAKVERIMREETYPVFLKSDLYVQYVDANGETPKSGNQSTSNVSSGSNSVRPMSGLLPTVTEDEELKDEDLNDSMKAMPPPSAPFSQSLHFPKTLRGQPPKDDWLV